MSARTLEAGAGLAAALGVRLDGLFVEDADLVHLGGLPFAREISAVTGAWSGLDTDEVVRSLRLEGARLERLLAQAAERARVPWSFATSRGRLLAQAVAREAELTILGGAIRVAGAARPLPAEARTRWLRGSLAVFFDASPGSFRALEVAGELAAALGSKLHVLVPEAGTSHEDAAAREGARSWLTTEGRVGYVLRVRTGEGALADALRASQSELLIHAVPDLAQSMRGLATLIAKLPCPLLIVRQAGARARAVQRDVQS